MRIIFARRRRLGSFLIRAFTASRWSHVAAVDGDHVYEVTVRHGVIRRPLADFIAAHSKHETTEVACDDAAALAWLDSQIGKGYDWSAIVGFILRTRSDDRDRWFCSELVESAIEAGGRKRFREYLSRITPRDQWMLQPEA